MHMISKLISIFYHDHKISIHEVHNFNHVHHKPFPIISIDSTSHLHNVVSPVISKIFNKLTWAIKSSWLFSFPPHRVWTSPSDVQLGINRKTVLLKSIKLHYLPIFIESVTDVDSRSRSTGVFPYFALTDWQQLCSICHR